jgi:hypothetical protein
LYNTIVNCIMPNRSSTLGNQRQPSRLFLRLIPSSAPLHSRQRGLLHQVVEPTRPYTEKMSYVFDVPSTGQVLSVAVTVKYDLFPELILQRYGKLISRWEKRNHGPDAWSIKSIPVAKSLDQFNHFCSICTDYKWKFTNHYYMQFNPVNQLMMGMICLTVGLSLFHKHHYDEQLNTSRSVAPSPIITSVL